ncbi:DUF1428 family protein [Microvirga makkahensis]|uniref:DUF1428 family protein n=1 Tax=Microvirga makkahensis TaxID=1128670 RepID=UPI0024834764|nr:DUF1428 family protein [Microvirga makkahensis]
MVWPSKEARDEGSKKVMADPRPNGAGTPFDGKRMFWGGFRILLETEEERCPGSREGSPGDRGDADDGQARYRRAREGVSGTVGGLSPVGGSRRPATGGYFFAPIV